MKKPKSLKGFLSGLVSLADSGVSDLRGSEKLSHDDFHRIVSVLAALQNELGDIDDILERYNMSWPPDDSIPG